MKTIIACIRHINLFNEMNNFECVSKCNVNIVIDINIVLKWYLFTSLINPPLHIGEATGKRKQNVGKKKN